MSELGTRRLHAVITGMVQGVNFRWFIQRRASELGLTGWVRNLPDGSVELYAEGARDSLEHLLDAVRAGPPSAVIENVNVEWGDPTGESNRFEIRY